MQTVQILILRYYANCVPYPSQHAHDGHADSNMHAFKNEAIKPDVRDHFVAGLTALIQI